MPLWRGPFSHRYSQTHKNLRLPVRSRYGVSFVDSISHWCSTSVPAIVHAIPYYIRPRYNGTRLYQVIAKLLFTKNDMGGSVLTSMVEFRAWMSNFTPLFYADVRSYPSLNPDTSLAISVDECNWNFAQDDDNHAVILCTCTICRNDSLPTFMNEWNFARLKLECYSLWICCSGLRPLTARVPGHQLKNDKNR